jgi:hypothetical protein
VSDMLDVGNGWHVTNSPKKIVVRLTIHRSMSATRTTTAAASPRTDAVPLSYIATRSIFSCDEAKRKSHSANLRDHFMLYLGRVVDGCWFSTEAGRTFGVSMRPISRDGHVAGPSMQGATAHCASLSLSGRVNDAHVHKLEFAHLHPIAF